MSSCQRLTTRAARSSLNILNGKSWPDLRTIARLENVFDYRHWGFEHRNPSKYFHDRGIRLLSYPKQPRDYRTALSP